MPRTPDGQPDLQGVWDFRTATPVERPPEFSEQEFLSDQNVAAVERRAAQRLRVYSPDDLLMNTPPWWLDYGTRVVSTRRSSLIVEPPDGRVPPMTPEGLKRQADLLAARAAADDPEGLSAWDRCVTRGSAGSDVAGCVQQQSATRADARVRRDRHGNDPRGARRAARRSRASPAAPARLDGRLARSLGRRHVGRRHHELLRRGRFPGRWREDSVSSSASRGSTRSRSTTDSRWRTRPPGRDPGRWPFRWSRAMRRFTSTRVMKRTTACGTVWPRRARRNPPEPPRQR